MDFPLNHGDFPQLCRRLPEAMFNAKKTARDQHHRSAQGTDVVVAGQVIHKDHAQFRPHQKYDLRVL